MPTALSFAISSTQSLLRTCRVRSLWLDVSRSLRLESRGSRHPRDERDVRVGPGDSLFCAHRMRQRASCLRRKLFARWPASRAQATTETWNKRAAVRLYLSASFAQATDAFRELEEQHSNSVFVEDATFLEALSLTKVGHVDAGAVAASRHLA